jgi:transcription elongation GreA/GreB family factor
MPDFDKHALVTAIRREIEGELATMTRLAREAAEAATHEENKPENDKDMRSMEASYVARGQAGRVADLERAQAALGAMALRDFAPGDAIETSALVELRHRGTTTYCFVVPAAGGRRVRIEGIEVQAITRGSPLGEALLGLTEGDEAEVPTPQGPRTYEIVRVS